MKTILVDADGVLEDLTQKMTVLINELYGTKTKYEDIKDWDLTKAFPGLTREQVYGAELREELYDRLEPLPGAVEYMKRLIDEGKSVYVVSSAPYQIVPVKMDRVIFKFFPFLTWKNIILTGNKQMVKGDILVDDGPHNLLGGDYEKILVTGPYNESFDAEANGMIRVNTWEEIYNAIKSFD